MKKIEIINNYKTKKQGQKNKMKKAKNTQAEKLEEIAQNDGNISFAVTGAVVFNKKESLYDEKYSTEIELCHDGEDSWLRITQEGAGAIEINFDEWPVLQTAVELIIKAQPLKL